MRHRTIAAILILAGLSCALCARAGTVSNTLPQISHVRVVRLSLVDGAVSISHAGTNYWQPALANMPIQEGDTLASASGFAEVEFEGGSVAYLATNSSLQFTKLYLEDGSRISTVTLTQGTASFYVNHSKQDSFEALTPDLNVTIPNHGQFRVDISSDGTAVMVYSGAISVKSSGGTQLLAKGETLSLHSGANQTASVTKNSEADAFDRWVNSQTQVLRAGTQDSLSYVNSPFSYGLADLDGYGSWLDCPGIGTCWAPGGIGSSWIPYADGFWSPFDGLGMTWISYEPWGWMPYHFGAWTDSPMYGWVWAPGNITAWQPAMVAWVQSGNQVGWVPLSPLDKPGRPLANLQHGFVVSPATTAVGAAAVNHVAPVANVHTTIVMAHAPGSFVSTTAPVLARTATPGAGFAGGRGPQPVVFDRATRSFVNAPASGGFRAPVASGVRNTFNMAPAPMAMPNRSYAAQQGGGAFPNGYTGAGPGGVGRAGSGVPAAGSSAPRMGSPAPATTSAGAAAGAAGHH